MAVGLLLTISTLLFTPYIYKRALLCYKKLMTPVLSSKLECVKKRYYLKEVVGQGCFGVVRKCQDKQRKHTYACKTILKSKVPDMEILRREVFNLQSVHHPHIIQYVDVVEDSQSIHLIAELVTGGTLYDRVVQGVSKIGRTPFDEHQAIELIHNILDAISYLHEVHHIVHRDLKAPNFMFVNPQTFTQVKIIDFGLSRYVPNKKNINSGDGNGKGKNVFHVAVEKENRSKTMRKAVTQSTVSDDTATTEMSTDTEACEPGIISADSNIRDCQALGLGVMSSKVGTPYYVAPEILTQKEYTNKCDVWSIGVISYLVLSGTLPFLAADESETVKLLVSDEQAKFDSGKWSRVSAEAKDFCRDLLQKNPRLRPTARQAMRHPWITQQCGLPTPLPPPLPPPLTTVQHRDGLIENKEPSPRGIFGNLFKRLGRTEKAI